MPKPIVFGYCSLRPLSDVHARFSIVLTEIAWHIQQKKNLTGSFYCLHIVRFFSIFVCCRRHFAFSVFITSYYHFSVMEKVPKFIHEI